MILVFVASWFIGNIVYLFPNLGISDDSYGFVADGGTGKEIMNISIYFIALVIFLIAILLVLLYIYKKYGKEVLSIPLVMVGMIVLGGIMSLFAGKYPTLIVIFMTIFGVIAFVFTTNKKGWTKLNIISGAIILLVGIPLVYIAYNRYDPGIVILDDGQDLAKIGESGRELVRGVTGIGGQNMGLLVIASLLIIIGVFITIPKIVSYIRSKKEVEEETSEIEQDLSQSVDRAIKDLKKGKDTRSTIIRCYQKMCFILEDYGVTYDRYMTPREFENNAVLNLNFSRSTISELTTIFEEARYSPHSLTESQRKAALKNLKSLKEEIV